MGVVIKATGISTDVSLHDSSSTPYAQDRPV